MYLAKVYYYISIEIKDGYYVDHQDPASSVSVPCFSQSFVIVCKCLDTTQILGKIIWHIWQSGYRSSTIYRFIKLLPATKWMCEIKMEAKTK